jgi:hypothetical protein
MECLLKFKKRIIKMAYIYEGRISRDIKELEKALKQQDAFIHPALNMPINRSYALLTAAILFTAIAVAGSGSASHEFYCVGSPGNQSCSTISGITAGEAKILNKNFTTGYDNTPNTKDDKILLRMEDQAQANEKIVAKIEDFRIETDISENLSALDKILVPDNWLFFHYQSETHKIVQIDDILSPEEYTQLKQQEEAKREAEWARNREALSNSLPYWGAVSAGGIAIIGGAWWYKSKKSRQS